MIHTRWSIRLGTLGAFVMMAIAPLIAAPSAAKSGGSVRLSGPHANEEFCRVMISQFELISKFDPFDMQKRAKYFADQKALNAKLVRTAPTRLAREVALQTTNANAMMDAQLARDNERLKASAVMMRSPANVAASKRIAQYCGATVVP